MSDKINKILSDKINDAVEHHEIPYNPKHWEQLKAKKNKKKRLGFWYWRIASVLVVMLLSSLFINYFVDLNSDDENNFKHKVNKEELIPKTIKDSLQQNPQEIFVTENETLDTINNKFKTRVNLNNSYKQPSNEKTQNNIAINKTVKKTDENIEILGVDLNFESENNKIDSIVLSKNNEWDSTTEKYDSLANTKNSINKQIDSILENLNLLEDNSIKVEKSLLDKRLKLGFLISSVYNIQENNASDNMMVSSGLSLEIPISNKFELFVGAIYSNQSFNLLSQSNSLSGVVSAKGNNIMLKSRATSISGIEIPLNLKYNFELNKRQLFVSAGISSVQYFNEQIENTFIINERSKVTGKDSFGNNFVQYELKQTENSVDTSIDSNKFEFLGSFNLSAGVLLPISKSNQNLIIEPYFKYSLSSITSQNVNYSNLGIQFRYNFSFKNK